MVHMMDKEQSVLTRSKHGLLTGTLRGLANYYGLSLNKLQLVFVILGFMGIGFVFYFVLWVSVPSYSQRAYLLQELRAKQE